MPLQGKCKVGWPIATIEKVDFKESAIKITTVRLFHLSMMCMSVPKLTYKLSAYLCCRSFMDLDIDMFIS